VDEKLQNLINEVCRHPDPSPERQKALNRLLINIQQIPGIYKSSHQDYLDALNRTWEWFCKNICKFEARSPSLQQSVVTWINGYLKWRIKDLHLPDSNYTISLDTPIGGEEDQQRTRLELLPSLTLDLLEQKIAKIQEKQNQTLSNRIRKYIEQDENGNLTAISPKKCPECHCQILAIRLILEQPPHKIADIAREFNISNQTLYSHWKNKCLPMLREIGINLGYEL
jgi:hypothetical protein